MTFPYAEYTNRKDKGRIGVIVDGEDGGKIVPLRCTDCATGDELPQAQHLVYASDVDAYISRLTAALASADEMKRDIFA